MTSMSEPTPATVENKNHLDIARWGVVLIGNRHSVLKTLETEFPFSDPKTADQNTKHWYGTLSFAAQIEKVMSYNRNRKMSYIPAVLQYCEHTPESEMTDELRNVPDEWREARIVRVEIHR